METWIIPAKEKMFDFASAFESMGQIDWTQRANFNVGDTVYIYCTAPYKRIMYKTVVRKTNIPYNKMIDDSKYWKDPDAFSNAQKRKFVRLELLEQADTDYLSLDNLLLHGLKKAPRGSQHVSNELQQYIDEYMQDDFSEGVFPESAIPAESFEGALKTATVNRYERSSVARRKCIEHYGCKCYVCGLSFEEYYGKIGEGFIHVHHIVPLNEIGEEYKVDYVNDLIPVCPNCHAMLHRKVNGKAPTTDELRNMINKN